MFNKWWSYQTDEFNPWCYVHPLIKDIPKFKPALQELESCSSESKIE